MVIIAQLICLHLTLALHHQSSFYKDQISRKLNLIRGIIIKPKQNVWFPNYRNEKSEQNACNARETKDLKFPFHFLGNRTEDSYRGVDGRWDLVGEHDVHAMAFLHLHARDQNPHQKQ